MDTGCSVISEFECSVITKRSAAQEVRRRDLIGGVVLCIVM